MLLQSVKMFAITNRFTHRKGKFLGKLCDKTLCINVHAICSVIILNTPIIAMLLIAVKVKMFLGIVIRHFSFLHLNDIVSYSLVLTAVVLLLIYRSQIVKLHQFSYQ